MAGPSTSHSHLFLVRVWRVDEEETGQVEYRGQVQHALSGELRHFREWSTLAEFCEALVEESAADKE